MHSNKEVSQWGIESDSSFSILSVSNTEYPGLLAGVGKSTVNIEFTWQLSPTIDWIFLQYSYQVVSPLLA